MHWGEVTLQACPRLDVGVADKNNSSLVDQTLRPNVLPARYHEFKDPNGTDAWPVTIIFRIGGWAPLARLGSGWCHRSRAGRSRRVARYQPRSQRGSRLPATAEY